MRRVHDPRFEVPVFGTGFYAEYFVLPTSVESLDEIDFDASPDMAANVQSLDHFWDFGTFWDGGATDLFAARYSGELDVETAGTYTFSLNSDDGSALYIDGELVIGNDGLHAAEEVQATVELTAGSHDIEIRYFEAYGAQTLRLMWETPDAPGSMTLIDGDDVSYNNSAAPADDDVADAPADDASDDTPVDDTPADDTPADDGGQPADDTPNGDAPDAGLEVDFFVINKRSKNPFNVDFDRTPDRTEVIDNVDFTSWQNPIWRDGWSSFFGARMSGNLHVEEGGEYIFFLTADDASSLYINGERLIDFKKLYWITSNSVTIDLEAGVHDIELRYVEKRGSQNLTLEWKGPDSDGVRAVIGADHFSHGEVPAAPVPDQGDTAGDDADGDIPDNGDTDGGASQDDGGHGGGGDTDGGDTDGGMDHGDGDHGDMGGDDTDGGDTDGGMDHGDGDHGDMGGGDTDGGDTDGGMDHGDGDHGDMGGGDTDGGDTDGGMDHGDGDYGDMGGGDTDGGDTDGGMDHGDGDHGDMGGGDTDGGDTDGGMDHGDGDHGDMGGDDTDGGDTDGGMDHGDGDHGDMGGDDTDGGDTGGSGGHDDHGGHGGGDVDLPTTPAEIEAFVAAAMAEPEAHNHHTDSGMAMEHGQLLDLVPRAEATHIAVANGDWFDASTWYQGRIPDEGAQVLIPKGVSVTYGGESDESLFTVRVDGELSFATDTDSKMVVDTFVVSGDGRLEIGTAENPIDANVNVDIVIANNGDIDVSWDPTLLSRGLISHGEAEIHGAQKDSFLKVSEAPMRGDTTLDLAEIPDGWQVGDTIVITGTHKTGWQQWNAGHVESEDEEVTITAINGTEITFDRALEHDHDTPRDDLFAYVANTSRNVTISSEDGDASAVHHRGHVMFMHSDEVDVRYAAFDDLGRTDKSVEAFDVSALGSVSADSNVKGRYNFHFHRTGTEDQDDPAMAVGNSASGSPGWAFTHHSSNANFTDNVAFDAFGAGFAAESGDETGIWLRNMAIRSEGVGPGDWAAKFQGDVDRVDTGRTGDGFFFAGRLVEAAENVAVNTTNGFVWMHRGAGADPLSIGLDHSEIAYGDETMAVNLTPIQGFRDNEAFGTHTGLMVIKDNAAQQQHEIRSLFDGFLNWETAEGVNISYTAHYTLKDFDLIAARDEVPWFTSTGVEIGAMAFDMVFNGIQMEGFSVGANLEQQFFRAVSDEDVDHIFIDMELNGVGRDFIGYNGARHHVLTSADLTPGQLSLDHTGDTTLSEGEDFSLGGIKTDSIGTREREYDGDPLNLQFADEIAQILTTDGYYKTQNGDNVVIIEDFIVDRATGEVQKFAHVVTLDMTDQQLQNSWALNNYFNGVVFAGNITVGGSAPTTRDDSASTQMDQAVVIDAIANDFDRDGDELRVDGFMDPAHGDVYMQEDGQLLYQPNIGYTGTDSFRYWAADDEGNFVDATVTVEIL
ncbi:PA14 domain-containing protein [Yoonia sp. SS1-5]|uniref:PA14 domain-containing protein n=1 Tax=Yoonia rhodophyticola TaxID=3137370 RepID=A0AAN0NJZ1_9RHOB